MNQSLPHDRILVVGAGISGILAARHLADRGFPVQVFDKARGVGGRMSTRRIGTARVDHGAQFFTANDPDFMYLVDGWIEARVVASWTRGFANGEGSARTDGRPAYRGLTGMNAAVKHLARGLDVRTGSRLTSVSKKEGEFEVCTETGERFTGAAVILTPPVPQSLALVEAGGIELPADAATTLRAIEYDPCFAVLVVLAGPSAVPEPGGLKLASGPIDWIADNTRKGISPERHAVTIHATAEFSRSRIDLDREEVGRELVEAARCWLGSPVEEVHVHRWLYSRPTTTTAERFLAVAGEGGAGPLVFAGDAFGGPAVEGAALSGLAAGKWVASRSAAG